MAWTFFEQAFLVPCETAEDPGVADLVIEGKYSAMERPKRNFEQKILFCFQQLNWLRSSERRERAKV